YKNIIEEKTLQLGAFKAGKYPLSRIRSTYHHNVDQHIKLVPRLIELDIRSFRLSSCLFPLWDQNHHMIKDDVLLATKLAKLGKLFIDNGIRVTTHPGQFTVLSSDSTNVVKNSIIELEYHAWVFDAMGLPLSSYAAINIHGGKANRSTNIVNVIRSLPDNIRTRLTLENDEKCYNVDQLLDIYDRCTVPIVFDSHHFTFNTGNMSFAQAFDDTRSTWGNIKPLQHISNTEPGHENGSFNARRAHSQYIHHIPDMQLEAMRDDIIDVDVEAKHKNLALLDIRKKFNISR
ncbi:UV DNA damage repair endonuclease UvsE, partial [bacterium]|nr:UV DNA damage repair endonuclease UvsE [Candidatus Elulimicrobium humile]